MMRVCLFRCCLFCVHVFGQCSSWLLRSFVLRLDEHAVVDTLHARCLGVSGSVEVRLACASFCACDFVVDVEGDRE